MHDVLIYGMILFDSINNEDHIGGPPLNVSLHMARMGYMPQLVSAVGDDKLGALAREVLQNEGVSDQYVLTDAHETGQSIAHVDDKGIPVFDIKRNVAYEYIDLDEKVLTSLAQKKYDLLYFGTVEQQGEVTRGTLKRLLEQLSFEKKYYDINLREGHYTRELIDFLLQNANILKLNDDEVFLINEIFDLRKNGEQEIIDWLFREYRFNIVIVTRGKAGASAYSPQTRQDVEGIKIEVKDTVGAGDAFSAGFIAEYLNSGNMLEALKKGNNLGAYVASQVGAVPAKKDV